MEHYQESLSPEAEARNVVHQMITSIGTAAWKDLPLHPSLRSPINLPDGSILHARDMDPSDAGVIDLKCETIIPFGDTHELTHRYFERGGLFVVQTGKGEMTRCVLFNLLKKEEEEKPNTILGRARKKLKGVFSR